MMSVRKLVSMAAVTAAMATSLLASVGRADTIKFPEEELAPESVLPIFDQPTSTKMRAISQAHRFEIGLGGSYDMTEPFFNPLGFGGELTYHWSEESAIELNIGLFSGSARSYDEQINTDIAVTNPPNIQNAPAPKYLLLASYQYTPFYGKLSVTKNYIMHMHLFGDAGIGGYKIGDTFYPAVALGLGPQFDFSADWSIKMDLRMFLHQGPNLFDKVPARTSASNGASTNIPASEYEKKMFYDTLLAFNVVYLIP